MDNAAKKHDSKYLESKHRAIFQFLDRNKTGRIHKSDLLARADNLSKMSGVSPEEAVETRMQWVKWCKFLFFSTDSDAGIDVEQFLKNYNQYFEAGRGDEINELTASTYRVLFDRIDKNRDGMIVRDELGLYYKTIGAADDNFIERIFRRLDADADGRITKEEFVNAGLEFWRNDDPSSGYEIMYIFPKK